MENDSLLLILVMVGLVSMSAFFSASETAFSSVNKIKLKNMAADGNKRASRALKLAEEYDTVLSTILIGNNIVNIACTSIATLVFTGLLGEDIGVTISTVVMTVVILIFGEITPKSVAKEKSEAFAMGTAPMLNFFILVLTPLNFFFKLWKKVLKRIFHLGKYDAITEEELITYVDEAQNGGEIGSEEGELIRSAIEFNDLDVADVLTPRVDMVAVEKNDSISDIAKLFVINGYSRLPVYVQDADHIVGVIHERDFHKVQEKKLKSIRTIIKSVPYVSEGMKISVVLRQLQKNKTHLAVVVDEFGGTAGIITLEDILEELVGEIWDEYDEVTEDITETTEGLFTVDCNCALDKFSDFFGIEEEYEVSSVGGWVMDELDKIPQQGDTFTYEKLFVTVTQTEQRRASTITVQTADHPTEGNDYVI